MIDNNKHYNEKNRKESFKIAVVGLGFVGLPAAIGFSQKYQVIGFDINKEKINMLKNNIDPHGAFTKTEIENTSIEFVSEPSKLKECHYIIVAVPTPITPDKKPNLTFLQEASATIGKQLTPNTTVIYESTVYPGTTEDVCIPILEKHSNLTAGEDFFVGYSPERINPGDEKRTFTNIPKVIAGQDKTAMDKISHLYHQVITDVIYEAPSIKVAEASKVVENTQRDVNIALMNELSLIFDKMNIDTYEVLEAAKTKWNFLPFTPGLVGGHCIGVDPYYLIHQSRIKGYEPNLLTSARAINEFMPDYVVQSLLHLIISHKINLKNLRVTVLGTTFKENIPDTRNSKALDIIKKLEQFGISLQTCDPYADEDELKSIYNIQLKQISQLKKADIVILAVPHEEFKKDLSYLKDLLKDKGIVMDLKGVIQKNVLPENITVWRL